VPAGALARVEEACAVSRSPNIVANSTGFMRRRAASGKASSVRLSKTCSRAGVRDQYKEKTPRDPTLSAKFNTYSFADYKEEMIKLLARVITVSLETVKITEAMRSLKRDD
jgi:hypothetical protein